MQKTTDLMFVDDVGDGKVYASGGHDEGANDSINEAHHENQQKSWVYLRMGDREKGKKKRIRIERKKRGK